MAETEHETALAELREALLGPDRAALHGVLRGVRPENVAAVVSQLADFQIEEVVGRLRAEDAELAAEVVSLLGRHDVRTVLTAMPDEAVARLVGHMPADDAMYVLELLPEGRVPDVVAALEGPESQEIRERLEQPEDSAARLMSDEYVALPEDATAAEAIARLQAAGEDVSIYYVYLTDPEGRLSGVVSLRRLLRVPPARRLKALSADTVVSVAAADDQERVAQVVAQQDLVCVPVVDRDGRLVGVITHDDVLDVMREEATEDMLHMAGTNPDDAIEQSVWTSVRARAPWLLFCLLGQMVTVNVLHFSEGAFGDLFKALVLFTPAIVAMGGNVGTQAATIVVRGLATGRVQRHDSLPILWREVRTSLVIAAVYGLVLGTITSVVFHQPPAFCLVVGLGLLCSMVLAAAFGTLVPIVFDAVGVDPAVATGPLVTTAMDVLGVGTYFALAGWLLTSS
jgi:magnesium transporter